MNDAKAESFATPLPLVGLDAAQRCLADIEKQYPELIPQYFLVPNEACVEAGARIGLPTVSPPSNSDDLGQVDWTPLGFRHVVFVPAISQAARRRMAEMASQIYTKHSLSGFALAMLPELAEGEDLAHFVARREASGKPASAILAEVRALLSWGEERREFKALMERLVGDEAATFLKNAATDRAVKPPGVARAGPENDQRTKGTSSAASSAPVRLQSLVTFEKEKASSGPPAEWETPIPLEDLGEPMAFPVQALPRFLSSFVAALAIATQTPVDLPAILAIVSIAACLLKLVRVQVRGSWVEQVSIFAMVVLGPANRKSAVLNKLLAPIQEFETGMAKEMKRAIATAQANADLLDEMVRKLRKDAAKETDEAKAAKKKEELEAAEFERANAKLPSVPRIFADDVTAEAQGRLMQEQGGRMSILSAEGGIFENLAGRYSDGVANLDLFLKGWSGDPARVDRIGRPSISFRQPGICIGLAVQPDVVLGMAQKPTFRGRGLIQRFLYSLPTSLVGFRDATPPEIPRNVEETYLRAMRNILADIPMRLDADGEIEGAVVGLEPDAVDAVVEFANALEPRLGPDGDLAQLSEWAGKLAGTLVRVAAVLQIAERAESGGYILGHVTRPSVERALQLAPYFIDHAKRAYSLMGQDENFAAAKSVLAWIRRTGEPAFTRRDAYRATRSGYRKGEILDRALALLEDHNYVRLAETPQRQGPGRRPSPLFEVNPACHIRHICQNSAGSTDTGESVNSGSGADEVEAEPPSNPPNGDPGESPEAPDVGEGDL